MSEELNREESDRFERLEARLNAMSTLVKTVITTLLLRGLLTKAAVDQILKEAAIALGDSPAGEAELQSVRADLPAHLRAAMGPAPDEDDHDH